MKKAAANFSPTKSEALFISKVRLLLIGIFHKPPACQELI